MIIRFLKSRTISFYLRIVAAVLALVPLFYMGTRITIESEYIGAIVCGVLGIAVHIAAFFFEGKSWSDYMQLAGTILLAAEFSIFLSGGALSVVDYIYGINFWGDSTQMFAIIGYGIVLFIGAALSVAACYMRSAYEKEAKE